MDTLTNLFNSFYFQFVLRDLFGKIVPGLMLLSAIAVSLTSPSYVFTYVQSMSGWSWIAAASLAWGTAFAVQGFGEKCKLIQYYPGGGNEESWYDKDIRFHQNASPDEKQRYERLLVIQEASGNGYLALSISLLLLTLDGIFDTCRGGAPLCPWIRSELLRTGPVLIVALGAIYYLYKMHHIHSQRQNKYMDQVLEARRSAVSSQSPQGPQTLVFNLSFYLGSTG